MAVAVEDQQEVERKERRRALPRLISPLWSRREPGPSSSRCSASKTPRRLPVSPRRSDGEEEEEEEEKQTELAYFL